jgi:transketolase
MDADLLKDKSRWVWLETLKIHRRAPETRIASSLSAIDIFVSLYYGGILNIYPNDPYAPKRDRCIISKGHGSICMYPILADLGYFPLSELEKVCQTGSFLGGIPDPIIPGYETVNGSLGHGLGVATGMALGLKAKGSDSNVFVVTGDGELHEGANWEAIMFAAHHGLDNLHLIIDDNRISMLDHTKNIIDHLSLPAKLEAFGWDCVTVENGHDVVAVQQAIFHAKLQHAGKPKVIIAKTKKGNGVPSIENMGLCHIMNPKPEVLDAILAEEGV